MGQLMRRHWMPAACRRKWREPDGAPVRVADARRGSRRVPRHRRPRRRDRRALPASPRVAAARPQRGMRAALPLSRLEDGRRRQRRRDGVRAAGVAPGREGQAHRLSDARGRRASSGSTWARPTRCPSSSRRRGRRATTANVSDRQGPRALQLGADPRGRDRLGAQLEPALDRHAARAHRADDGGRRRLGAPVDRQVAAHAGAAHQLRLPLRGDPPADQERRRPTTTCASPCSSRRSPC